MSRLVPASAALTLVCSLATLLAAQEQGLAGRRPSFFDRLEALRRSLVGDDAEYEAPPEGAAGQVGSGRAQTYTAGRNRGTASTPGVPSFPSARPSSRRRAVSGSQQRAPQATRRPSSPAAEEAATPGEDYEASSPDELWPDEVPLAAGAAVGAGTASARGLQAEGATDGREAARGVQATDAAAHRGSDGRGGRAPAAQTARLDGASRAAGARVLPGREAEASAAGPIVRATARGPKRVVLGKAATYTVEVHNEGASAALALAVTISLPEWASVERAQAQLGSSPVAIEGGLEWQLERLEPGGAAQLKLDLVPRERRPIELGVRWTCAAAESQLEVEVHEPRLQLSLAGPRQVEFGSKQVYTLTLVNSGDGDATQVEIQLMPLAAGDPPPGTYKVGTLPAGASKTVELELLARQSGSLEIQAVARSAEGLEARLSELIEVLRPQLTMEVTGPSHHFALAPATYQIRVRNQGNAVARNLRVSASLPPRGQFLSSGGDAEGRLHENELVWSISSLPPGGQKTFTLQCALSLPGDCRVEALARADHGVQAAASHATHVTALADLVLDVRDPNGPVAVGDTAVYELRIANRGAASAEQVQVVVYFSTGVEPLAAEGSRHEISTGTVQFAPIRTLGAGQELVLRIQARAETAGSHKLRVELTCPTPETSLVVEESTLFYKAE